jgi:hypothetical protein
MAIKVGGTTVINDSRQLSNITSVDATTVAALGTAGVGGGGTAELTAASTLTAGQAVIINTSGQAAGITKTIGSVSSVGSSQFQLPYGGSDIIANAAAYDSINKKIIALARNSNGWVQWWHGNVVTDTGSEAVASQGDSVYPDSSNIGASVAMTFDPDCNVNGFFLIVISDDSNNNTEMRTAYFNGNSRISSNNVSLANRVSGNGAYALVYDTSLQAHILISQLHSGSPVINVITLSSSGYPTSRLQATMSNTGGNYKFPKVGTDGNGQFLAILGDAGGSASYAYPFKVTGSIGAGFSISQGTRQTLDSSNAINNSNKQSVKFDTHSGKFLISYGTGTSSVKVRSATISNNSLTLNTAVTASSLEGHNSLLEDKNAKSAIIYAGGYNNATFQYRSIDVATNGNVTLGTASDLTGYNAYFSGSANFNVLSHLNNPDVSLYTVIGNGNNANDWESSSHKLPITSDSSKFVGFATAGINSGASGDITVIGGVNEQQSGLTAGSKHYVNSGGAVTTDSGGTYAGVALSATKLLVKG